MKTLNLFVVELKKIIKDTIATESGFELYVDSKFEGGEFEHRVTEGPVVCAPLKYDTGVKKGDTIYFHHLVVVNEGQALTGVDDHYLIYYDDKNTINNQAIAYKCKDTGEVKPLAGWSLLEPVQEKKELESELIELVSIKEKLPTTGKVAFDAPWLKEMDISAGDIVGFQENRDYRIKIDGKEYYRTRAEDLMYKLN
jgi:co-chaperonin GroES (HSP10)